MAIQYETGVQNLVWQMDAGTGRKITQVVLAALFAFAMAALYTFTNFQGFKDARAMEEAQLARNYAARGDLMTHSVRPLSVGLLAERSPEGDGRVMAHPDLLHPPGWPALLGWTFRAVGIPRAGLPTLAFVNGADYVPVALSHFFMVLSALWVWLIGRKLFDGRVAALSMGAFLLSDVVWRNSVLGGDLSAATFFGLGATYAMLWAAEPGEGPAWRWLVPLVSASLLTAAAFLTRYSAGTLALALFLYVGLSRGRRPWAKAALYLALAVLPVVPWMVRNASISGHLFGLAPMQALAETHLFPGDSLFRTLNPEWPDAGTGFYFLQVKMVANLRELVANGFGMADGGLLLALFGAMYLHRFVRPSSRILRWCLVPAGILLALAAAAFGEETARTFVVFWPLAIPYAWAFFLVLLDRLQFELRHFAAGAMALAMAVAAFPLLLNVLPPRSGLPYPPYFHRYVGPVAAMLRPEECMVTDMPWAVGWYGDRTAILLPRDLDGFFEIHERHQPISAAYFTTLTRDKPWVRGLSDPSAAEHGWYQIFAAGRVPSTFPLAHGRHLSGTDQFILADRPRW
jgi:hypothetical protein